ncbi:hypothetical protein [Nocardia vulneris]|uniref:hypothetical protein n=1 Tax=Nocardia vulneris TaxID=1141657 RepID=UPI000A45CDDB|nr:hypothetical protein [Nocardia vulneris]
MKMVAFRRGHAAAAACTSAIAVGLLIGAQGIAGADAITDKSRVVTTAYGDPIWL